MQNAGRANRIDPNATLSGAFINNSNVNTIDDVRIGCEYEQQRDSLLNSDYLKSILALEACCKVDNKINSFNKAFKLLLNGGSFNEI